MIDILVTIFDWGMLAFAFLGALASLCALEDHRRRDWAWDAYTLFAFAALTITFAMRVSA
jgi:hypothetical protein